MSDSGAKIDAVAAEAASGALKKQWTHLDRQPPIEKACSIESAIV